MSWLGSLSRSEFQKSNESIPESPRSGSKKSSLSPQSSFSSNNNKIFRKSRLTNNLKDDSNQLLSEERDKSESCYNNYIAVLLPFYPKEFHV